MPLRIALWQLCHLSIGLSWHFNFVVLLHCSLCLRITPDCVTLNREFRSIFSLFRRLPTGFVAHGSRSPSKSYRPKMDNVVALYKQLRTEWTKTPVNMKLCGSLLDNLKVGFWRFTRPLRNDSHILLCTWKDIARCVKRCEDSQAYRCLGSSTEVWELWKESFDF